MDVMYHVATHNTIKCIQDEPKNFSLFFWQSCNQ